MNQGKERNFFFFKVHLLQFLKYIKMNELEEVVESFEAYLRKPRSR